MDEFMEATPLPESAPPDDDPFGMSAPEPLAPPDDPFLGGGDIGSYAPPGGDMGMGVGMDSLGAEPLAMPASEPLPTFGDEPVALPEPAASAGLGDEFAAPSALGPLAKWRIEQQEKLAAKAAVAEEKLAERVSEAQAAIAQFYAERTDIATKRSTSNREAEAAYIEERDAAMVADSWESVWKLIDVKTDKEETATVKDTSKETTRMKQVLLKLKHT